MGEVALGARFLSTREFCRVGFMLTQEFLLSIISFISNSKKGKIMEIFSLLLGDGVVHFDYQHYVNKIWVAHSVAHSTVFVSRESGEKKTKCDRIAPSHPLRWPCVSDLLATTSKARAATHRNPR